METLTEITTAERERRERAALYERLTNEATSLRRTVERLRATSVNLTALESIVRLAGDIPAGITTRASRFVAGGFEVREFLERVARQALDDAQRKAKERQADLDHAKAKLAKVEAALKEFD